MYTPSGQDSEQNMRNRQRQENQDGEDLSENRSSLKRFIIKADLNIWVSLKFSQEESQSSQTFFHVAFQRLI